MDKESFGERLAESEDQFRDQFDPTSNQFHGGLQQVVPTGGERVPESMPTVYPEGFDQSKPAEVIDYGEEYARVEKDRAVYQELKKYLAKLGPIVESFLRHEEAFKLKGDPSNEKHIKTHHENLHREGEALKQCQTELALYIPQLQTIDADGKDVSKELGQIIHDSGKKYSDKESLTDFNFKSKKLSSRVFALAQKSLQRIKDIKKAHSSKPKAT